jgi:catechol 2,3-dioxygenase-like lactoylglutathione lyase family enzyme
MNNQRLPGIRGIDHVGFSVPDMDQAIDFFANIIGCEVMYRLGRQSDPEGTYIADNFGLHPRTVVTDIVMLRCFNGSNIELHHYEVPDQNRQMPRLSDVGGVHIGLYTDKMDEAIAYLRASNIRVLGGKKDSFGPEAGPESTFIYTYTPWGLPIELVSFPFGKAYEATHSSTLYQTARPEASLMTL